MVTNGGGKGGLRSELHQAVGVSKPPPTQEDEHHHLLTTDHDQIWEDVMNKLQTPDILTSGSSSAMVGSLAGACSTKEMVDKQLSSTTNDLERLRNDADPEGRYVNPYLAVKSFQRSDASKTFTPKQTRSVVWCRRTADMCLKLHASSDLVPVPWLYRTQIGLKYKFLDIYNFLRDRFRGLWQDLTIQHAPAHQANIEVLEISCRLLILAEELLCDEPEFNAVQNGNLLSTCVDKLMNSYEAVRQASQSTIEVFPSLAREIPPERLKQLKNIITEFWCYRILLCLSSHDASTSYYVISKVPSELRSHSLVELAIRAVNAFHGGNLTRYFKYSKCAPPLVAVLLTKFTDLARYTLLNSIACDNLKNQAPRIPAQTFCKMFSLESYDALVAYCESINAQIHPQNGSNESQLDDLVVDVRNVETRYTVVPKSLRFKRTPDIRLRHILNTFEGGRLRLLDPRVPYQADV